MKPEERARDLIDDLLAAAGWHICDPAQAPIHAHVGVAIRSVKSRSFFEQMKGRGVRVCNSADLQAVTPDARVKDHFVMVDAVGLCERDKTDSRAMGIQKSVSLDNVFKQATEVSIGTAQMTVPLSGLRSIAFGLPPKAEQVRIVAEVDRHMSIIREVETEVEASLKRGHALRQATLFKAF